MDKNENLKFLDTLSTQMLENFLEAYQTSENPGEEDLAVVQYILDLLARRSRETDSVPDVDRAWQEFHRDYLPLKGQEPLFGSPKNVGSGHRGRKVLRRLVTTAAVLALLFVTTTFTAYACGFDIWEAFASWTADTFGFVVLSTEPPVTESADVVHQTNLAETLREYGIDEGLAPTWIPEGYYFDRIEVSNTPTDVLIGAYYKDDYNSIAYYVHYMEVPGISLFEIDPMSVEECIVGETHYYISENCGLYRATWFAENIEFSINGCSCAEDVHMMLQSIYGG